MKFNTPLNNFTSGEWSPKMLARTDTEQYLRSCSEITNMLVQMQGGAQYRAGTSKVHVDAATQVGLNNVYNLNETPTAYFKSIPYEPSVKLFQAELIIAGSEIFALQGSVMFPVTIDPAPAMIGWVAQDTQYQQIGDLLFLSNSSGGFKPKVFYWNNINAEYVIKDIDNVYITTKPWKTIPWSDLHALDEKGTLTVVYASNTVGSPVNITATGYELLSAGSYVRVGSGTSLSGVMRITGVTGPGAFNADIVQVLPQASSYEYGSTANSTSFYQVSAWSQSLGWPRAITAYQGRIIFGGNNDKPDTIWGARIGNLFDYEEVPEPNTTGVYGYLNGAFTADNSRPFALSPNFPQSGSIRALAAAKTLNILTDQIEIVAYGNNGALGPVNVTFESSTSFGSLAVMPVRVNNYSTFVQANGFKLRDLVYNFNEDQYKASDLSFVAEHLFTVLNDGSVDKIQELVRYEGRSSVLLVKTELGNLYYVTLDRDYQVNAWGRIVLGKEAGQSNPEVLAVSAQIVSGGTRVTMIVARNGVVTIERLNNAWELENPHNIAYNAAIEYPVYLDCAYKAVGNNPDGQGNSTIWVTTPDLSVPYPASQVSVLANGMYLGEFTIAGDGTITLPRAYAHVYIGLKYEGTLITSPLEQGGQFGVPVGRIKRADEIVIRFHRTCGCFYGTRLDNLEEIPFRANSTPMGLAPEYFSGDKVVNLPGDYTRQAQIVIKQDKPYPMYVVCVAVRGSSND